jgi:hypothetical protein
METRNGIGSALSCHGMDTWHVAGHLWIKINLHWAFWQFCGFHALFPWNFVSNLQNRNFADWLGLCEGSCEGLHVGSREGSHEGLHEGLHEGSCEGSHEGSRKEGHSSAVAAASLFTTGLESMLSTSNIGTN